MSHYCKATKSQESIFKAMGEVVVKMGQNPDFTHLMAVAFKLHESDKTSCDLSIEFLTSVPDRERVAAMLFVAEVLFQEAKRLVEEEHEQKH
jgi:hypothetical protein